MLHQFISIYFTNRYHPTAGVVLRRDLVSPKSAADGGVPLALAGAAGR